MSNSTRTPVKLNKHTKLANQSNQQNNITSEPKELANQQHH